MSSKLSDSSSEGSIPPFPDDRAGYEDWKTKMTAYLHARKLLSVVIAPPTYITHKTKLEESKYAEWVSESEKRLEQAETKLERKKEDASVMNDDDVKFKIEHDKCTRAASILLQSFKQKQLLIIKGIFQTNPHEMWKKINQAYGVLNTGDTVGSLITQLTNIKKKDNERVSDYIARINSIICQLETLGEKTSERVKIHYIMNGLKGNEKWTNQVNSIRRGEIQGRMTESEVVNYLESEDNAYDLESEGKVNANTEAHVTTTSEVSFYTNRGGGSFRGRGGSYRGRGGGNFIRDNNGNFHRRGGGSYRGRGGQNHYYNQNQQQQAQQKQHAQQHQNQAQQGGQQANQDSSNKRQYEGEIKCYNCGGYGHINRYCSSKRMRQGAYSAATLLPTSNTQASMQPTTDTQASTHSNATLQTINDILADDFQDNDVNEHSYSSLSVDTQDLNNESWIFDTAATCHHTGNRALLSNIKKLSIVHKTQTGNGESSYDEVGETYVKTGENQKIKLCNVVYVPNFKVNLISAAKLIDKGCTIISDKTHGFIVKRNNQELFRAEREGNLFIVKATNKQEENNIMLSLSTVNQTEANKLEKERKENELRKEDEIKNELKLMHQKYGHVSYAKLMNLIKNKSIEGVKEKIMNEKSLIECVKQLQQTQCDGCMKGKMNRLPMTGVIDHEVRGPMDMWAVDVMGPMRTETMDGHKFVLVIVDVYTRLLFVQLMKTKGEAASRILNKIKQCQTQTSRKLKRLHSDGGREIINNEMINFLNENGTTQTNTTPHTPQHIKWNCGMPRLY